MGGFDDLDQAVAEEDDDPNDGKDVDDVVDSTPDSRATSTAASTTEDTTSATDSAAEPQEDEEDGLTTPAFAFGDTKQQQLYVRPEIWSEWEDLQKFEVERELADRGIRNVEGRELDEAALRVLLEHPEEVADYVEETRRSEQ